MLSSLHSDHGAAPRSAIGLRTLARSASRDLHPPGERPRERADAPVATSALVDTLVATLGGGSTLVPLCAQAIARELGLADEDRHRVALAALLRDAGDGGRGEALDRPRAEPSLDDRRQVEAQAEAGLALPGGAHLLPEIRAALTHRHERWDGRGEPDGLSGERIPLLARILAVAEAFVGRVRPGTHSATCLARAAMEELAGEAGLMFDPVVVAAAHRALLGAPPDRPGLGRRRPVLIVHAMGDDGGDLVAGLGSHGYLAEQAASIAEAGGRLDEAPVEALLVGSRGACLPACDFIEALRADSRFEALPVVAFDAGASDARIALLRSGADAALSDEVTFDELRGTLDAILARRDRRGAGAGGGGGRDSEQRRPLEGELQDFSLAWLLQALHYDGRDGSVRLRGVDGREGMVRVEGGVPRHARVGDLLGEDALRELLGWNDGRFRVEPGLRQGERTIEGPLMRILLQEAVTEDTVRAFGAA